MTGMGGNQPTDLAGAFARYRATQAVLHGNPSPSLDQIDAALAARVELFHCLVDAGWDPPAPVTRQIDLDDALLHQPRGSLGG